jgi:predicted transcriptional regulator
VVTIELDPGEQQHLEALAKSRGQNARALARQILRDYLEFQSLPNDTEQVWAEASVAMASEFMEPEDWGR